MKRTLLEISCGLAVVVLLVSFNHQIARLKVQNRSVDELREMVADVSRHASSREDLQGIESELKSRMEARLADLEVQLAEASAGSREADSLKRELAQARTETEQFKLELTRHVNRTKDLVSTYMSEVRATSEHAAARIDETATELAALKGSARPDRQTLTCDMLLPTVQLNGDDTVGSGTLVYSGLNPRSGEVENYVLTSYHVVRNILADTPKARQDGFEVTLYGGDAKQVVTGDMIAHNARIDAAVVKLRSTAIHPHVANVLPRDRSDTIGVWDHVHAVGCPLGNDPVPSAGELSSKANPLGGANYWMINAPTYFGNSGGGVYLSETRQLIGVFSKIYTHGKGNPVVVPHMGLCTPMPEFYSWLDEQDMAWILEEKPQTAPAVDAADLAAPAK